MSNKQEYVNKAYLDFKKYKNEIFLDTFDSIKNSKAVIAQKTLSNLGTNELHHVIKYYQKILLNTLYFNDQKILKYYNKWLYRVYYYRSIDLDFFPFLTDKFKDITNRYINSNICIKLDQLLNLIYQEHDELKNNAAKKRILIDHENESIELANNLINANKDQAYNLIKQNSHTLDKFLFYYQNIVSNAMKYIGYMWEIGKISVAKEHISSNTLNETLTKILDEFPQHNKRDIHIFISSAPNELHGLGIKIASSLLEKQGFKVTNIGTNIPSKEIRKAILEFEPDIILLSATLLTSLLDIALLIDDITKEKSIYANPFKIGVAGGAFEDISNPAKTCKADFYLKKLEDIFLYI